MRRDRIATSARVITSLLLLVSALLAMPLVQAAPCAQGKTAIDPNPVINGWGGNAQNHRFVPRTQAGVTPANLERLTLKWVFALPDTNAPRSQALVTADTVVIGDAPGKVYALDRETGCEKWRFDAGSMVRTSFRHAQHKGAHLLYFGTLEAKLFVVDLHTGKELQRITIDDHARAMISGSAVEHGGMIYQPVSSWETFWAANPFYGCCTFRGSVVAVSMDDWLVRWRAYTIAQEPQLVKSRTLLPDHYGPSGAPVWSQPTLDVQRQRIYIGTGQNYSSPATDTSDAILAYDLHSGQMLWKQQFLDNDAWNLGCVLSRHINCPQERGEDVDFGAPPILVSVDGEDYLLAGQKSGWIFAMNPDRQGEPRWRYKAGAGGKAGGVHFGMAVDPVRGVLYVPISDRSVGNLLGDSHHGEPNPSLQAIDITTGQLLWETDAPGDCLDPTDGKPVKNCHRGFSAAVTATEDLVFAPTLDGVLRVFDAHSGKQLWAYDAVRDFPAVNAENARGGAFDLGGVYLDGGQLFVNSGYGQVSQIAGNAFMVFEVDQTGDSEGLR